MRAAILRRHDHKGWKLVPLEPGQSEDFDSGGGARRTWLYPHLGDEWHLVDFCDLPESGPKVGDGTGDAALAIGEHAFRAGFEAAERAWRNANDAHAQNQAWDAYDPPEDIKALS